MQVNRVLYNSAAVRPGLGRELAAMAGAIGYRRCPRDRFSCRMDQRDERRMESAAARSRCVSSPIVWNDRVIVTYQIGANALRPGVHPTLVQGAGAATSGEHPLGGARPRDSAPSNPIFAVAAFDRKNGRQFWEYTIVAEGDLPQTHEKRNLATPSPDRRRDNLRLVQQRPTGCGRHDP